MYQGRRDMNGSFGNFVKVVATAVKDPTTKFKAGKKGQSLQCVIPTPAPGNMR